MATWSAAARADRAPAPRPRPRVATRTRVQRRVTGGVVWIAVVAALLAGFVYIERQADPVRAAALAKRHIAGLGFYPEERRAYPQGAVGAQLLGYVGVDDKGLAGIELQLDSTLAGRPGHETIVKDATGRAIDVVANRPAVQGRDVTLTIDHTIQANAEEVLRATVQRWGAKSATAVVLDPRTGEVLALAVEPG